MNEIKLVLPDVKYKDSFLSAIPEFRALEHKRPQDEKCAALNENMSDEEFAEYVKSLHDRAKGLNLKPGRVPKITWWIIDDAGWAGARWFRPYLSREQAETISHLGVVVRPGNRGRGYQRQSMRLALAECAKSGLSEVCIVYGDDNVPSGKNVIAIFNEYGGAGGKIAVRRHAPGQAYWINTEKK